jgi:hypothetical protein
VYDVSNTFATHRRSGDIAVKKIRTFREIVVMRATTGFDPAAVIARR